MTSEKTQKFSTGIKALDNLLQDLQDGDNVVFKVDRLEDFIPFVHKFARQANKDKKKLIYFRFAQHEELIPSGVTAEKIHLNPKKGFESFISEIIEVIDEYGSEDTCYIFDLLSDLTVSWYSDVMVANFFMLTCPYLYKLPTIAYFALLRNLHEENTCREIQNTAQIIFEIYNMDEDLYIHPLKVENRFTPNIYSLHKWVKLPNTDESLENIVESAFISKILSESYHPLSERIKQRGTWHLAFKKAEEVVERLLDKDSPIKVSPIQAESLKSRLLKMIMVKGDLLFILAANFFTLQDLLKIGNRLIGTGSIGGKAIGMLIARNILKRYSKWKELLEESDSFYIGTEVFYTYLIKNDCWWLRRQLCSAKTLLQGQEEARERILNGEFPKAILDEIDQLLDYFGQSPIIVRSSSLLEDAYGNSFSGKYDSIILANQGTPEERKKKFLDAIREVYASAVSTDAVTYRRERDLLEQDEAMAILVQRLSGSRYGDHYFPQAAGVGYSFNPYVWDKEIDSKSGMLRLVLGLGTRAVDRTGDDYTRITALNKPELRPEHGFDRIRTHSQKKVDLVDLTDDQFKTVHFDRNNLIDLSNFPIEMYADKDPNDLGFDIDDDKKKPFPWVLTFTDLLKTSFPQNMRDMLKILEDAYQTPVDIEFTVNFVSKEEYFINLVQCRPLHIEQEIIDIEAPKKGVNKDQVIFKTSGPILGASLAVDMDYVIYIVPRVYGQLSINEKYEIARLVGKINSKIPKDNDQKIMILGPGRWGTSSPSLGIPVNFAEVNGVSVIGEIAEMHEGLVPDISLGTHFFNNIVELNVLYFAIQKMDEEQNLIDYKFFESVPNILSQILPDAKKWEHAIKVIDKKQMGTKRKIKIHMNSFSQEGFCYWR